ncbi:hypothetical protein [Sediminibacterium sp.]|jgi:hypothetical protein|uniref:hypothetical protein n=1 Tax=Sediminibacterium sp. TaxID=1917865 RepID=UPI0025FE0244|nr:hypothetical protein [Sediminibacterium sp.]MBW0178480.1 hypothetical protein [Sediminibacterium sp.]
MKFTPGQPVIVLDTEYKPAGTAIIKIFNLNTGQYTVNFKYANSEEPEEINIPEERLILKQ